MTPKDNILIVDDDPTVLTVMRKLVEGAGHSVTPVSSAQAALDVLSSGALIDVMVSDVCMPGMDGLELLKQVKTKYPNVEVIMVTGFGTLEMAVQTLRYGAFDYLKKPFKVDEFLGGIQRALEHRKPKPV